MDRISLYEYIIILLLVNIYVAFLFVNGNSNALNIFVQDSWCSLQKFLLVSLYVGMELLFAEYTSETILR